MKLGGLSTELCYWQACVRHTVGAAKGVGRDPKTKAIVGMMVAGNGGWTSGYSSMGGLHFPTVFPWLTAKMEGLKC